MLGWSKKASRSAGKRPRPRALAEIDAEKFERAAGDPDVKKASHEAREEGKKLRRRGLLHP